MRTPYNRKQFPAMRAKIDPLYEAMFDQLNAAYADWKEDISHPWRGHDKATNPTDSRVLYFKLRQILIGWYAEEATIIVERDGLDEPTDEMTAEEIKKRKDEYLAKLAGDIQNRVAISESGTSMDLTDQSAIVRS